LHCDGNMEGWAASGALAGVAQLQAAGNPADGIILILKEPSSVKLCRLAEFFMMKAL
jgi:hypothetical protein